MQAKTQIQPQDKSTRILVLVPYFAARNRVSQCGVGAGTDSSYVFDVDNSDKNTNTDQTGNRGLTLTDGNKTVNKTDNKIGHSKSSDITPNNQYKHGYLDIEQRLQEMVGLAEAIELEVVRIEAVKIRNIHPATLFGSGKVAEFKDWLAEKEIKLVIVDHTLSVIQQRNLEKALAAKVIDRKGLILEIFSKRARSSEGRLQVELAYLEYRKSRLVRSWTHLERQRGSLAKVGGPGEKQIESDRRQIENQIDKLKRRLERVVRVRKQQKSSSWRRNSAAITLVGYTNAGKSSLFNKLAMANVKSHDMLFATLDPTLRQINLPHGRQAFMVDTVGFITDLPTELISAFRSTLEEVIEADLIIHVHDITSKDRLHRADEVMSTLAKIGVDIGDEKRFLNVYNKADLLFASGDDDLHFAVNELDVNYGDGVLISASTGFGLDNLMLTIENRLAGDSVVMSIELDYTKQKQITWLYRHGDIISRHDDGEAGIILLQVRLPEKYYGRYRSLFANDAVA